MNSVACFVGLDYHQDFVQVCVLDGQGRQRLNRACRNDWQVIAQAVRNVGPVQAAALEACGGSADLAQQLREQAGWPVDLAHPGYVAKLKQAPDKSDYSDGRLLADLTRVGYLPKVWLASGYERDLRALVQYRQGLVDQRRAVKLRAGALLREQRAFPPEGLGPARKKLGRWTRAWMAWARAAPQLSEQGRWILGQLLDQLPPLEEQIRGVEARLREVTAQDPKVAALRSEAGIGEVTAWVLRAFVGPFERFASGKQLSRYCGLSPCNASSGARQADAGLIQGCNRLLRATLIQAAHRLIRTVPRWRNLADSLRRRGKPACVAVAAVANRWMRGLWHRQRETIMTQN
jgi:transposase